VLFPAASVAAPSAVGATIPGEKQFRARRRSGAFTRACEREELLPEACEIRVAGGSPLARETCPENPTWRRANFSALSGSALELVSGKGVKAGRKVDHLRRLKSVPPKTEVERGVSGCERSEGA
jgi:hypothetical protein